MKRLIQVTSAAILLTTAFSPAQAQDEQIYVAVEPCRIVDTRKGLALPVPKNGHTNFLVSGGPSELFDQGGSQTTGCPAPPKSGQGFPPAAIAAYVIAVPAASSTSGGVLTAYPSDQPQPPVGASSTVNFAQGQPLGNTTIITLCTANDCPADGQFAILARNTDEHVVIDVLGYFYPVPKPQIQIVSAQQSVSVSGSTSKSLTVDCPDGAQVISGGGFATGDTVITDSYPVKAVSEGQEAWISIFASRTGGAVTATISAVAVCVAGFETTAVYSPVIIP
jgi:hypothetical protein